MVLLFDRYQYHPLDLLPNSTATYKALDTAKEQAIALEIQQLAQAQAAEVWQANAQAQTQLQHPQLLQDLAFRLEEKDGLWHCYTMRPLLHSGSWAQEAALQASYEQKEKWIFELLDALDYLHHRGFICQDLQPAHLLINENNQTQLIKYAKTQPLNLGLVVDYSSLAPEQFEPIEQPQTSLDLWALGICIAWLFRGQMPFGTKSAQLPNHRLKARILEDEPPFWVDELPHPYNVLVARCLDKDPDTRLQTIAEFKALWAAEQANHAQIAAEPSPQTQKAQKPVKSSRSKEIPWLLYLVLGILAAVLGYWLN